MTRSKREQAAFIAGLEAARRDARAEERFALSLAMGSPEFNDGRADGAAHTADRITDRIRREKAKGRAR